jgi:hypothetical protein
MESCNKAELSKSNFTQIIYSSIRGLVIYLRLGHILIIFQYMSHCLNLTIEIFFLYILSQRLSPDRLKDSILLYSVFYGLIP